MREQDIQRALEYRLYEEADGLETFRENYNIMIDDLNKTKNDFPVRNLSGQIMAISVAAGTEIRVSHSLESIPKYRLILGQTGDGVITDVKEKWTDKYITLLNNGAVTVTLDLMIIKE